MEGLGLGTLDVHLGKKNNGVSGRDSETSNEKSIHGRDSGGPAVTLKWCSRWCSETRSTTCAAKDAATRQRDGEPDVVGTTAFAHVRPGATGLCLQDAQELALTSFHNEHPHERE